MPQVKAPESGTAASGTRAIRYLAKGWKRVGGLVGRDALLLTEVIDRAQKQRGVAGHVGEIGVFYGQFFIYLSLLRSPGERAVAIDIFGDLTVKDRFLSNLRKSGADQDTEVLHRDSADLTPENLTAAAGGRLRLLSIDGAHSFEGVLNDLCLARDVLADGGAILLDDYFHEEWPGVSEATNKFFLSGESSDLVPFAIGANKLALCHARDAGDFQAALGQTDFHAAVRERRMFGARVLVYNFRPYRILGLNISPRWTNSPLWRALKETALGNFIRFRLRKV